MMFFIIIVGVINATPVPVRDIPKNLLEITNPEPFLKEFPQGAPTVKELKPTFGSIHGPLIDIVNPTTRPLLMLVNGKPIMMPTGEMFAMSPQSKTNFNFKLFNEHGEVLVIAFVGLGPNNEMEVVAVRKLIFSDFAKDGRFFATKFFIAVKDLKSIGNISRADIQRVAPLPGMPPLPPKQSTQTVASVTR